MGFDDTNLFKYIHGKNPSSWKSFESFQILDEANIVYINNLYLPAMSGYWVFIENYLRQNLIFTFLPEDKTGNPFELFQKIDEVEKEIEEDQYKDLNVEGLKGKIKSEKRYKELSGDEKALIMKFTNTKRMFQHIVGELVSKKRMSIELGRELITKYHNVRSAVQHGTYRRLYNTYKSVLFETHSNLSSSIHMSAIVGLSDPGMKTYGGDTNSCQNFIRMQQIGGIAKIVCEDSQELIISLLKIFETDYLTNEENE